MSNLRVDSRWWYWVAAVPLVTAFWAVSSLWVAVVAVLVPEAVVQDAESVVSIPAVALGVPALVVFLVLPLALYRDARAIDAAGGDWPADVARYAKLAVAVDALVFGGGALFFEGLDPLVFVARTFTLDGVADALAASTLDTRTLGALLLGAGAVAGSWLAVQYLRERRDHVVMPSTLWEWRDELRAGDRREPAE
ncbi:MAG: hypothetical protein ABEH83_13850 [Halobacterium sp.]